MPPKMSHKTLTAEQKDKLKRWIAEGAEYESLGGYRVREKEDATAVTAEPASPKHPTAPGARPAYAVN